MIALLGRRSSARLRRTLAAARLGADAPSRCAAYDVTRAAPSPRLPQRHLHATPLASCAPERSNDGSGGGARNFQEFLRAKSEAKGKSKGRAQWDLKQKPTTNQEWMAYYDELRRQKKRRQQPPPRQPTANGAPQARPSNEELTDHHDEDEDHYFDDVHHPDQQQESELQEWHGAKEEEFRHLASSTERRLEAALADTKDVDNVLSLMGEWNAFASSISTELYRLSDFRRRNKQYPPSEFMTNVTYNAAEMVESLLVHLLEGEMSLPPKTEVEAYKLSMNAWSHAFHPRSGDRCEAILEQYGERFGGDMNYMPSIEEYKTVLGAHGRTCSSDAAWDDEASPGERALGISRLLTSVYTAGDIWLKPDAELYSRVIEVVRNTLLDHQSKRRLGGDDASKRELEMELVAGLLDAFERMESALDEEIGGNDADQRPSLDQWHGAIRAYADVAAVVARIPLGRDANVTAEGLLSKLEDVISTHSRDIVYSMGQSRLDDDDARGTARDIQSYVEECYTSALLSGLNSIKDESFVEFASALDNANSAEELFQRMRNRSEEAPQDGQFLFPPPTTDQYRALIECWCECVRKRYSNPESNDAMARLDVFPHSKAEGLLKELEAQSATQPIDGSIHAAVMWAWSQVTVWPAIYRQNDYHFASNAMYDLLQRTMEGYKKGSIEFVWNGTVTKMYNFLLRLNARNFKGGEWTMKRSLKLLDQMEYWYGETGGAIAQPDAFTFGLILKSIANSGVESSASHAEALLKRMDYFGAKPREKHFLAVIRAYSRVGQMDVVDPNKAEAILQRVKEKYRENGSVKPTTAIYTACISAYGGSRRFNSVSKVMELFEEVSELYKETEDEAFKADSMLYGAVIDAVSKAKTKNDASLRQAMQLLDRMEKKYDTKEIETGPNRYSYTNLLRAISRSRSADKVSLAEDLIQRMDDRSMQLNDESLRPDTQAYTTLVQALSQSRSNDSIERAQRWIKQMEHRYEGGDTRAKPNKVTYTAMINCWRSSGRPEAGLEAEKILELMERKYEEGDLDLKPDAFVYAAAIDAWAQGKSHDKAARAWDIYQRMKEQYSKGNIESKPNNVIMTSIIKACGYTRGDRENKEKALRILLECMADLKREKWLGPNSLTYRTLLNAAKALMPDDSKRRPISANIFEVCCRAGQLDSTVLEALEHAQPELYAKLPAEIPPKWKQHVVAMAKPAHRQ